MTIEDDTDPEAPRAVRTFALDDKTVAPERLLDRDAGARRYRHTLLDPVIPPVGDCMATLAAHAHADGAEVVAGAVQRNRRSPLRCDWSTT
ncbi:hypothetical protein ACFC96_44190 [Streptomyces sp. NPDC055955]|uniref:hypothetical protein n=1 Tax=Streptomyces sp. NPDC055955 TaxID=3345665 RepID=UPI0035DAEE85